MTPPGWSPGPCTECGTPSGECRPPDYCCPECLHLKEDWDGYPKARPRKPWWYPLICRIDGFLHTYICNLVEKYADEPHEEENSDTD